MIQDRGSEVEERTQVPLWPLLVDIFVTLGRLPNALIMWGLLLPCMLYVPGPECEEGFWQPGNYSHPALSLWAPAQARALREGQKAASPVAFLESQFPQPGARVDLNLSPDHPRPRVSSGEGFLEVSWAKDHAGRSLEVPRLPSQNTLFLGYGLNTSNTLSLLCPFWPYVPAAELMASLPLLPAPCHSSTKGTRAWRATLAAGAFHAAVKFSRTQMRQESQE